MASVVALKVDLAALLQASTVLLRAPEADLRAGSEDKTVSEVELKTAPEALTGAAVLVLGTSHPVTAMATATVTATAEAMDLEVYIYI